MAATIVEEDGFAAARLFSQGYSYTYDDVIFLPHFIDFPTDSVRLASRLSRNVALSIPCVSSPMDTVTEAAMAAAMAALGGIGIVHSNLPAAAQAAIVRAAKSRRVPILAASAAEFRSPDDVVAEFGERPFVVVTESGSAKSRLLGYAARADWEKLGGREARVSEFMLNSEDLLPWDADLAGIEAFLAEKGRDAAAMVKDGEVVELVTREEVERMKEFPRLGAGTVGSDGEWMVGAAVGTREEDKERVAHLVRAGTNVVVIDSSQGNSIYQIELVKHIKLNYPGVDVVGGNVVTISQAQNLIQAGVDGLRVGMGSGSICTTQEVCAVGRGQVWPESHLGYDRLESFD